MDYSYYLKKNIPNKEQLKNYGFELVNNVFVLKKQLTRKDLYTLIEITDNSINARVIDSNFNEDFIPFNVNNVQCPEKAEVSDLIGNIINKCFTPVNVTQEIIEYLKTKYGTIYEQPWSKFPNYYTFKTANRKKWYAIIMDIKREKLGLVGNDLVNIINVKIETSKIANLVDNEHYFYAYHLNKKNWITILLDKNTNMKELKALIDNSYSLIEK